MYLPLWVCQVLVVAHGTTASQYVGSSSLARVEPGPSALGVGVLATTRGSPCSGGIFLLNFGELVWMQICSISGGEDISPVVRGGGILAGHPLWEYSGHSYWCPHSQVLPEEQLKLEFNEK